MDDLVSLGPSSTLSRPFIVAARSSGWDCSFGPCYCLLGGLDSPPAAADKLVQGNGP